MQLLILADDFTGAGDAAAPFAAAHDTLVVLSATDLAFSPDRPRLDVLSVDLDLRECADPLAQHTTDLAARRLCANAQEARVFLKIDSTLRGPIAGLVAGALSGSGKDIAVIAPAFPEQGRLLHEGRVVVGGQAGASLTAALGMHGTALLGARFVGSVEDVEQAVEHARTRGARRVVVDASDSDCLRSVAGAWRAHPEWLLVGSGGLARQVAGAGVVPSPGRRSFEVAAASGPMLVIAGSPTSITRVQIDHLRGIGSVSLLEATAAGPRLPFPPAPSDVLVLCTSPASERDAGEAAAAIAATVGEWSRTERPSAVVIAGGATARLVCERVGAAGVQLCGELSPGVPIGRLVGGAWADVVIVTKAGGFGTPTTLLDAVRALGVLSISP